MQDTLMFLLFVLAGVMCDLFCSKNREGIPVITAYCLLALCGIAVVISIGVGIDVPSPGRALEASLEFIKK